MEHSDLNGDQYYPYKFYKRGGHNPNYGEDLEAYEQWLEECFDSINQAARAANWFADIVRRDINPLFFAEKGKFLVTEGPFSDLTFRTSLREYTQEEKDALPMSMENV
ncbi:hypothetical protein imdm_1893 [gamma proteobacterium IMCC2047]|nr:hypothetical protein imdm_1893 [gamma proteobacterium IMCC2047]